MEKNELRLFLPTNCVLNLRMEAAAQNKNGRNIGLDSLCVVIMLLGIYIGDVKL